MVLLLFVVYALALAFIFLFSIMQLSLVFSYLKNRKKYQENWTENQMDLHDFPQVTIQLPLYNEKYVVERLIDQIVKLDYPTDKLEIQILDDSTDETTQLIEAKILAYKNLNIQLVRRPNRVGYKAGALKYGLEIAKGEFIAIFDADFLPDPNFLKRTLPYFKHQHVGVVQTRWGHINEDYSLLTSLQAFGLDAHFTIEQIGRKSLGHFINFNGTGGIWRRNCILDAGNWEDDTLTEDLDLSYRAQLKHWEFVYLEDVVSPAELPITMNALKSQQFRWTKGAAESAKKHVLRLWKSDQPFGTKWHGSLHLLNSSVFVSVLTIALLSIPVLYVKNTIVDLSWLFTYVSWFLFSFASLILFYGVSYFRLKKFSVIEFLKFLVKFPLFLSVSMGLSLHNGIAVIEGFLGKKTPFIRTPKFNITSNSDSWKNNLYRAKSLNPMSYVEFGFGIYFLAGIILGFYFKDYSFLTFHSMLFLGYSFVFVFSLKHAFGKE